MNKKEINTPAKFTKAGVNAIMSLIPYVNTIAIFCSELALIQWKERREVWEAEMSKAFEKLNESFLEKAKETPNFASILASTYQAALLDIEEDKVKKYINTLINVVLEEKTTDAKIHIFLNILREFTIAHINLLTYISSLKEEEINKSSKKGIFNEGSFPDDETKELRDNLLEDLYRYKLVSTNASGKRQYDLAITERTFPKCLTPLGREFLDFISEHQ